MQADALVYPFGKSSLRTATLGRNLHYPKKEFSQTATCEQNRAYGTVMVILQDAAITYFAMVRPLNKPWYQPKNQDEAKSRLTSGRSLLHLVHLVCSAGVTLGDLAALTFPFGPPFLLAQNIELTVPNSGASPSLSTNPGRTVTQ
jgi:hypothetical protein